MFFLIFSKADRFSLTPFLRETLEIRQNGIPSGMPFLYFHVGEILLRKIHLFHLKGLAIQVCK